MSVLVSGRRAHQIGGLNLERLGEPAHGVQTRAAASFEALNGAKVDADSHCKLALKHGPRHAPVLKGRDRDSSRTRRHRPTGKGTGSRWSVGIDCHWRQF